jgi:large repetitive protein
MRFTRVVLFTALLALVVAPVALALRFTDESYNMPVGVTGQAYSHKFDGAGGCGPALPYQYRVLAGALPPGLSLSKAGQISGAPSQPGNYTFWVELSDENPPSASWCAPVTAQREFTIQVVQGLNIQQNALAPKVAAVSAPYSFQLTATGGSPSWSVVSGALPPGMSLSPSGLVSGTPTGTGDFTFQIRATDGGRSDTETFTLSIVEPLRVTNATPAGAEVGAAFSLRPNVAGGRPGYTWAVQGTLPAGLTLDPATGAITGKPTGLGAFPFKLVVTDSIGLTQTVDVNLAVAAHLAIAKRALKAAKVGSRYSARMLAIGGVTPRQWNILGGRPGLLPKGLKLNRTTGMISGTPTQAGTFRLRLQVVDHLGVKAAAGFVLKVKG